LATLRELALGPAQQVGGVLELVAVDREPGQAAELLSRDPADARLLGDRDGGLHLGGGIVPAPGQPSHPAGHVVEEGQVPDGAGPLRDLAAAAHLVAGILESLGVREAQPQRQRERPHPRLGVAGSQCQVGSPPGEVEGGRQVALEVRHQ
jgi:hypothetical protein